MEAKKKNTAKIAETNTNELGNGAVEEVEAINNLPSKPAQENIPESLNEILSKVPKEQIELVNSMVPGLIPYLMVQEHKVNYIMENMPTEEGVKNAFMDALKRQQETALKNVQASPPQNVSGLGSLLPLVGQMMGGGGDNSFNELGKELMAVQIERMKHDMSFTDSIKNAIVSRLTSKAVGDIAEGV